jgi:hypothetical protein
MEDTTITSESYQPIENYRPVESCKPHRYYKAHSTPFVNVKVKVKAKAKATLRLTVSQLVSLGVEPHLGFMTRYLLLFDSYGLVFVGRPL